MFRILPFAAVTVLVLSGSSASAQTIQGPLLVPPTYDRGSSYGGSIGRATPSYLVPESYRGGGHSYDRYSYDLRYTDPRMRQVDEWYRELHRREMTTSERRAWNEYLRSGGELHNLLALILGGDEFYRNSGGRFDRWVPAVADVIGHSISREEAADWYADYRRAPDPVDVRVSFVQHLITEHGPPQFQEPAYGAPSYGRPGGSEIPWYAGEVPQSHGLEHTTAFRPAPTSDADAIAGWYQTYFGREIAPHEMQKWLSDRAKGMPMDEIYASVLGADEWYGRTGGSPTRWVAATLDALGQPAERDAVGYWLDRYRRHGGDRFKTALDMVRTTGGHADYDRRRDRRDYDRDDDD